MTSNYEIMGYESRCTECQAEEYTVIFLKLAIVLTWKFSTFHEFDDTFLYKNKMLCDMNIEAI